MEPWARGPGSAAGAAAAAPGARRRSCAARRRRAAGGPGALPEPAAATAAASCGRPPAAPGGRAAGCWGQGGRPHLGHVELQEVLQLIGQLRLGDRVDLLQRVRRRGEGLEGNQLDGLAEAVEVAAGAAGAEGSALRVAPARRRGRAPRGVGCGWRPSSPSRRAPTRPGARRLPGAAWGRPPRPQTARAAAPPGGLLHRIAGGPDGVLLLHLEEGEAGRRLEEGKLRLRSGAQRPPQATVGAGSGGRRGSIAESRSSGPRASP
jgi:hypothetical protein